MENLVMLLEGASASKCPCIMNTASMSNAVVNDEKIIEKIDYLWNEIQHLKSIEIQ